MASTNTPDSETKPGPDPREHPAPVGNRFFTWMRSLGIVRDNSWIGGVCGGIGARLGIDPLIVRGILVVVAVLGGPAFLFYAAAWLLLPDSQNNIHLERLLAGHFEPPVVAIAVIGLLTFLPITQGIWAAGSQFWGEPFWLASIGRTLWSLLVIGLIIALVVWAARSHRFSSGGGDSAMRTASADPAAPGTTAGQQAAPTAQAWAAPTAQATAAPAPPTAPAPSASADDLEAWKRNQAAFKAEHDEWARRQLADQRAVRQQRSAELRAQSQALTAEADEARRVRRLANPRTSGAYVGIAIGIAILAGAIAAAVASTTADASAYSVTIGFAVATLAIGLSIMLAGALRRRSGFLSFLSLLLVATTVLTALPPRGRDFVLFSGQHSGVSDARVYMPIGAYSVYLDPNNPLNRATSSAGAAAKPRVIDIDQGIGGVDVYAEHGLTVRVEATQRDNAPSFSATTLKTDAATGQTPKRSAMSNGSVLSSITYGTAKMPDVIVRISQGVGSVSVTYNDSTTSSNSTDSMPNPSSTPTPSPTSIPTP